MKSARKPRQIAVAAFRERSSTARRRLVPTNVFVSIWTGASAADRHIGPEAPSVGLYASRTTILFATMPIEAEPVGMRVTKKHQYIARVDERAA